MGPFFLSFLVVLSKEAVIFAEFELFTTYLFLPHAYFSSYLKILGKVLLDMFSTELSIYLLQKRRCGSESGSVTAEFFSNRAVKNYNPYGKDKLGQSSRKCCYRKLHLVER